MPKGVCPRCGETYYGWALLQPKSQYCGRCGTRLIITIPGHEEETENPSHTENRRG